MSDVPLAPPTPSASTAATTAASPGLTAVQVSVIDVPAALETLLRAIQTNATPLVLTEANVLTLSTTLGNIGVALSQQLSAPERQKLTQQLIGIIQAGKALTLSLQPGSPPTHGALLIPTATPAQPIHNVQAPPPTSVLPPKQLAVNDTFRVLVLPPLPEPALAPETGKTYASPPSYTAPRPIVENEPPAPAPKDAPQAPPSPAKDAPAAPKETVSAKPSVLSAIPEEAPPQLPAPPAETKATPNTPPPYAELKPLAPDATQRIPLPARETPEPLLTPIVPSEPSPPIPSQETALPQRPVTANKAPTEPPLSPLMAQEVGAQKPALPPISRNATPLLVPETPVDSAVPQTPQRLPPAPMPSQTAPFVPGDEVSLRVISILPSSVEPSPPLAPNQACARVMGTGTNDQLILKTGDLTLFVKARVTAPVGTTMIVSLEKPEAAPPMPLPPARDPSQETLPKILESLEKASPLLFHSLLSSVLPQPTEALPGALMFLLSAFKRGNVRGWLGDDAVDQLITEGKSEVVRTLTKELNAAGQPAQDPVIGEWRSYPIPLYSYQHFQALTLYVHKDKDRQESDPSRANRASSIRFLIDMSLSKLGAMQVDGFVQPKKLDMILRSENLLPEGLHEDLRLSYIKALDAVGYAGTLTFQVGRQHWIVMKKDAGKGIVT